MNAIVLAAGHGPRLSPLTDDTSKAIVEVADTPLIGYAFDALPDVGINEFVLGYTKGQIIERYDHEYRGVPITYVHQREQLCLAHALLAAEPPSTTTSR